MNQTSRPFCSEQGSHRQPEVCLICGTGSCMQPQHDLTEDRVEIPPAGYQAGPLAHQWWEITGSVLTQASEQLGSDMAFSVVLSRLTRELRRIGGPALARTMLQGFADSMDEAAKHDQP